jgi:hypothetical protein
LSAGLTWYFAAPGEQLIGMRQPLPRSDDYAWLRRPPVDDTKLALKSTNIWGVQRNGQPFPPPKPAQQLEAEKSTTWRIVGTTIRKNERYILLQVEKKPPIAVKEGELLPDGSKLLKINPKSYVIESIDGEKNVVATNL